MIAEPPFEAGAFHASATAWFPGAPTTAVGASGTVGPADGVTAAEAAESGPVPAAFVAATVKVYAVPFVRPVTVRVVAAEPVLIGACAFAPMYGVIR